METDAKIQHTIQIEFAPSTLICIAHRLNVVTVLVRIFLFTSLSRSDPDLLLANYDRVIAMDRGKVAEFDTVLNLFDKADSIFPVVM